MAKGHTGACVWLTGLSGAGKTTTARALLRTLECSGRSATLLDGDELRATVSLDLGFSPQDRAVHVMRAAAMAKEIVQSERLAICALVSPFRASRAAARVLIGDDRFFEIYVATPLRVCEARDPKGIYGRVRRREITGVSGVDQPYEPPHAPELVITTADRAVEHNVVEIMAMLSARSLLA